MSLVIRRTRDGDTHIEGDVPDEHVFPARFLQREVETGLAEVTVTLNTADGLVAYQFTGFESLDDGKPNFTGWSCRRITETKGRRRG